MDLIDRQTLLKQIDIDSDGEPGYYGDTWKFIDTIKKMPSAVDVPDTNIGKMVDTISRQAAIDELVKMLSYCFYADEEVLDDVETTLKELPSAQPEQRYTEEELRVFKHGISLSLLSKRSAQHWHYDEDTATEIKFLERLYEKVSADMRGEQDG